NGNSRFIDLPASYHNSAAGISFTDRHSEIHKWRDNRTSTVEAMGSVTANNRNVAWLHERTSAPR
ncbi:MAG: hypothetical protein ABIP71_14185, partial [Verrucomicrobiota bacterium]